MSSDVYNQPTPALDPSSAALAATELGDLVTFPTGAMFSVRARATCVDAPVNVAGFVVLGELDLVALLPARGTRVVVCVPSACPPREHLRAVMAGECRYWAPHLPSTSGAMATLLWRLVEIRGVADPGVLLWRGSEMVAFTPSHTMSSSEMLVDALARDDRTEAPVRRHAAYVMPSTVATVVPQVAEITREFTETYR